MSSPQPQSPRAIPDPVPSENPGVKEIGFTVPQQYNASRILFDNLGKGRANSVALTGPLGERTYSELCTEACLWGHGLISLGLQRGDRILMFLDDTPAYPAAFFGAVRAGFVPLLINTLTPPDLLQFYLADSGAAVAVTDAEFCSRFDARACKDTALRTLIVVNGEAADHAAPNTMLAERWLGNFPADLAEADTDRNEMAFWMYSSGSTGRPKGIVHLQHDMAYTDAAFARNVLSLKTDDICFSVPKVFFAYGFGNSITFPFCAGAATLLLPGQPKQAAIFKAIERYRPSVFFGLPTLYTSLTKADGAAAVDFSSLRMSMSAAEVLSAEVYNGWKALTGLESSKGSAPPNNCTSISATGWRRKSSAPRACASPAMRSCYETVAARTSVTTRKELCGCAAIPARHCTGTGRTRPPKPFATAAGFTPVTVSCATAKAFISFAAAPTT